MCVCVCVSPAPTPWCPHEKRVLGYTHCWRGRVSPGFLLLCHSARARQAYMCVGTPLSLNLSFLALAPLPHS